MPQKLIKRRHDPDRTCCMYACSTPGCDDGSPNPPGVMAHLPSGPLHTMRCTRCGATAVLP